MITLGVDLAAEPRSTAVALVDWDARAVLECETGVDDHRIVALAAHAVRVGIDCPFGWPDGFVDFVTSHRENGPVPPADSIERRRPLAYRATDLHLMRSGHRPLSVSADRIGHAAFRCAGLLARLAVRDRSGDAFAVETYPAGSLRVWGRYRAGYKRDAGVRDELTAELLRELGVRPHAVRSDHELDAVVCAAVARAAELGLVEDVPVAEHDIARREGWIRLPTGDVRAISSSSARTQRSS